MLGEFHQTQHEFGGEEDVERLSPRTGVSLVLSIEAIEEWGLTVVRLILLLWQRLVLLLFLRVVLLLLHLLRLGCRDPYRHGRHAG